MNKVVTHIYIEEIKDRVQENIKFDHSYKDKNI